MFEEELSDLEDSYNKKLEDIHRKVVRCLPHLLYYMEEFLILHKQNEDVRERLDILLAKTGRQAHEEEEDFYD